MSDSLDREGPIPESTRIVRGIRAKYAKNGKIDKAAFLPRTNGKDDNGLSLSEPKNDNAEQLRVRMRREPDDRFCILTAAEGKQCCKAVAELEIFAAPRPWDPFHALMVGLPTGKDPESKALANRLAELLAANSSEYPPPEDDRSE